MKFLLVSEVSKVSENLSCFILLSSLVFGFATNQKAHIREKNQDRKSLTPLTSLTGVAVATVTQELREAVTANRAEIIRRLQGESPSIDISEPFASFNAIERCFNGNCGAMVAFKAGRGVCKRCGVYQRTVE